MMEKVKNKDEIVKFWSNKSGRRYLDTILRRCFPFCSAQTLATNNHGAYQCSSRDRGVFFFKQV